MPCLGRARQTLKLHLRCPRRRTVARRGKLVKGTSLAARTSSASSSLPLLEEGASEHKLDGPQLVEVIDSSVRQGQCVPRLLLGEQDLAGARMNLGK